MNFASVLAEAARLFPDNTAVKTVVIRDGDQLTYKELDRMVNRLASGLASLGVRKGDRVAIYVPYNWPETLVAYFAAARAGAVTVFIDSLYTAPEAAYIIGDSSSGVIVTTKDRWEALAGQPGVEDTVRRAVLVDHPGGEGKTAGYRDLAESSAGDFTPVDCLPDDVAVLGYTSGTTGRPKGAMITHGNLCFQVSYGTAPIQLNCRDRFLAVVPLTHSYMFAAALGRLVKCGAALVLMGRFMPDKCLEVVQNEKITALSGTPVVFAHLLKAYGRAGYDVSSLRLCTTGGSPVPGQVWRDFQDTFKVDLIEVYGLTETSVAVTIDGADGERVQESAGRAAFATRIKIVGDDGRELPAGEVGEVAVSGPQVMKGYWNRPAETAEVLRDGWFLTGDLGRVDDRGYLFIVDRKKDMILTSGYNVYPREVEEVLYGHGAVLEAAVAGVPDPVRGELVKAFIIPRPGSEADPEEIAAFCRERLAPYKVPRQIEIVEQLPRTAAGKVQRYRLRG
ncbi:MAG: class I adenylate-forming enzyme family protein [Bacillota bacterium]